MIATTLALRYWKPLAAAAACAALVWGYVQWRDHQREVGALGERTAWKVEIDRQKREAAGLLDVERARVERAELEKRAAQHAQGIKDTKNAKTISDLRSELGRTVRLRDPNAAGPGCGCSSAATSGTIAAGATPGAADGTEAGGLLSAELTGLLQRLTHEADEVNAAYEACRADAFNVRR